MNIQIVKSLESKLPKEEIRREAWQGSNKFSLKHLSLKAPNMQII